MILRILTTNTNTLTLMIELMIAQLSLQLATSCSVSRVTANDSAVTDGKTSACGEYFLGYVPMFGGAPSIILPTNELQVVNYTIEVPIIGLSRNGTLMENSQNAVTLPQSLTGISHNYHNSENNASKSGIYLSTNRLQVTVIGQSSKNSLVETFFALPVIDLCLNEYVYYGVSVDTCGEADGSVVVVGTENETMIAITVPVDAHIKINNTADWFALVHGKVYLYKISRLQILYISAFTVDLTGTKVVANKPAAVFSGHECAFVYTKNPKHCNHLVEQIPPTELWGTVYYVAPLLDRTMYSVKIIAAYDFTEIYIECNNSQSNYTRDAGGYLTKVFSDKEYCVIHSNLKILVVQISHSRNPQDQRGNPMMTLIPSRTHYTSTIISSTLHDPTKPQKYKNRINIIVLEEYYQPEKILLTAGGKKQSLEANTWVPIVRNDSIEAYATQIRLNISHGVFEVTHNSESALLTVVVYGFLAFKRERMFEGYGHPGWIMGSSVMSFSQSVYRIIEGHGPAYLTIVLNNPLSANVTIQVLSSTGTANGEHVDYDSGPYKITIPSGKTVVQFGIQITDDTTLEGDEYFDVTIDTNSLPCGYTIGSIGQARVIIVTDDSVMVSFNQSTYSVNEDDESAQPVLVLSNLTTADITVQVTNTGGNAVGGVDYDSGPYTVTFPAGVTSVSFDVPIFEDDIVEDDEYIVLSIISNLLSSGVNQDYPNTTMIVIAKNDIPTIKVVDAMIEALSGETVTLECHPSETQYTLYWNYTTIIGTVSVPNNGSDNQPQSSHLTLPTVKIEDSGNYTCSIQNLPGNISVSQTISLTVVPACGLDRLSYGVLWPITSINSTANVFCSDIDQSFGFGPSATRHCSSEAVWDRVYTSQCSIKAKHYTTLLVFSAYIIVPSDGSPLESSPEITKVKSLYADSKSVTTKLRILPQNLSVESVSQLFNESIVEGSADTIDSLLLAPIVFSAKAVNDDDAVENFTQRFKTVTGLFWKELLEFKPVDICVCGNKIATENDQLQTLDICIGPPTTPCVLTNTSYQCNIEEGYTGHGMVCARDSDHDSFPDVGLNCSMITCMKDECPFIATTEAQDQSPCQPLNNETIGCSTENDSNYGISWPSTVTNMTATIPCPGGIGNATRSCSSSGQWEAPVVAECSSYEFRTLTNIMKQVNLSVSNNSTTATSELNSLITNLAIVTDKDDDDTSEYPADLETANKLLEFSVRIIENDAGILSSQRTVQDISDSFSNILSPINIQGWTQLQMMDRNQSQILLKNSERFGLLLAKSLDQVRSPVIVKSANLVTEAKLSNTSDVSDIFFPKISQLNTTSSIIIPKGFIHQRSDATGIDPVPIVNILYKNIENILPNYNESFNPVSEVISSQVTNSSVSTTSPSNAVQLIFQYNIGNLTNISSEAVKCGYWNFSLHEGRGGWDTEGVTTISVTNNTITCNSSHLTSFAVLVDVSGGHKDISKEETDALSIVTYIGCGVSIICLLVTIIVLVYYSKTLAKGIHNFVHINLSVALLLALVIFVGGIETAKDFKYACKVVAALLHYFFTAVFTWMLCEGIMLYFLLVKVFNTGLGQKKLFYLAIGWGIPLIIVAVTAGVAHDQYGEDDYCWIKTDSGALWSFVAPMIAVIIVNIIFLVMALHSLYESRKNKMLISDVKIVKSLIKATIILLPLLGVTWVFGVLAVNQESSAFAWIFTVFNSLQGMFILIFHVIRNEKIQGRLTNSWKTKIQHSTHSGRQSSAASKTDTQKTTSIELSSHTKLEETQPHLDDDTSIVEASFVDGEVTMTDITQAGAVDHI